MAKSLLSSKNKPTFIMYGFLIKMHSILSKYYFDIVVYAYDSDTSVRKLLYAEYKENRSNDKKSDKDKALDAIAYPQFETVRDEIIPAIGWRNRFLFDGFEADDIIGKICKKYKKDTITILSNDGDLYQLLNNRVVILNPKNMRFFNASDFIDEYGMEPKMWKRVKAYGGCSTDNVKGLPIPGSFRKGKQVHVAQRGAINYVLGKTPKTHKAYQAFVVPENKKILERNKKLVILPHRDTPDVKIMPDNKLSQSGLRSIAEKYEFNSVLFDFKSYVKSFKLRDI